MEINRAERHSSKFLLLSLGLVLGLSLSACSGMKVQGIDLGRIYDAAGNAGKMTEASPAEEAAIGLSAANTILSQAPLLNNQGIQRYVNRVGYHLASHSERPELNWRFAVIDNTAVNAYAAPNGYVFITSGLLAGINNEAELAGVLAHEIVHVVKKHHLIAVQKKAKTDFWSDVAVLAVQASQASSNNDGSDRGGVSARVDKVVNDLYSRGLDRGDEFEADRMAVVIAARAGYDPYAFASVLQALASRRHDDATLLTFLKVHPNPGDRLSKVEPVLERLMDFSDDTRVLSERYVRNVFTAPSS